MTEMFEFLSDPVGGEHVIVHQLYRYHYTVNTLGMSHLTKRELVYLKVP